MKQPHLTPEKLFDGRKLPPRWDLAHTAFICFTPFPSGFKKYISEISTDRLFLHSPCQEVKLCHIHNTAFIVISEVYGFEVGSTTVEELIYYGVKNIIAVGYVGAFNGASLGQPFLAKSALSDLPLARYYGVEENTLTFPEPDIYDIIKSLAISNGKPLAEYAVWCTNSIYREFPETIQRMKELGCDVVNMDTLSLYAVAPLCSKEKNASTRFVYVGTVTDTEKNDRNDWQSDLMQTVINSAEAHDSLVVFMVEEVVPSLTALD